MAQKNVSITLASIFFVCFIAISETSFIPFSSHLLSQPTTLHRDILFEDGNSGYKNNVAAQLNQTKAIPSLILNGVIDVLLSPIDTIKSEIQATRKGFRPQPLDDLFAKTAKGVVPFVLANFMGSIVFWSVYDQSYEFWDKKIIENDGSVPEKIICLCASASAAVARAAVCTPLQLVKRRIQVGTESNPVQVLKNVITCSNTGVWTGFSAFAARDIMFSVLAIPFYGTIKAIVSQSKGEADGDTSLSAKEKLICSSVAGILASAVTTPLDTVKTRIMSSAGQYNNPVFYKNFVDCAKMVAVDEGVLTFFKGMVPRVGMATIGSIIIIKYYTSLSE